MKRSILLAVTAVGLSWLAASCGREAPVGTLEVVIQPAVSGAVAYVEPAGSSKSAAQPMPLPYREVLPLGFYTVRVEADGYLVAPTERSVRVNAADRTLASFALARLGELIVDSDPAGAVILLDGEQTGETTPHTFTLVEGEYTIALTLDGYLDPEPAQVTVSGDAPATIDPDLVESGYLEVMTDPTGATISIDDVPQDETTPLLIELATAEYVIKAAKTGFAVLQDSIVAIVEQSDTTRIAFDLIPESDIGELTVTSTPSGADIFIDAADQGTVTPHTFDLPWGEYEVEVVLDGYTSTPEFRLVDVPPGGSASADFVLTDEGELSVTSVPVGASIIIDDEDTGEVTPHTFALTSGSYDVTVLRHGFHDPAEEHVSIVGGGAEQADFLLVARRIALMETMSGANCSGCPAMNLLLANFESLHGPEEWVSVKYSGPFGGADPHYDANPSVLQARQMFYFQNTNWDFAAPTLFFDGDLPVSPHGYPPTLGDLEILVNAATAVDPGFAVDIAVADWDADPIAMTIDLVPTREVDAAGYRLYAAVVESPIVYDEPPGAYGETEFHWVCREFQEVEAAPLPVSPAAPGHFEVGVDKQANWTGVVQDNLWAIVFLQNPTTRDVLQTGALPPAGHDASTPAPRDTHVERAQP